MMFYTGVFFIFLHGNKLILIQFLYIFFFKEEMNALG